MSKLYVVKPGLEEREEWEKLCRLGKSGAWKIERAHALLKCDQGVAGPGTDERIADAYGMTSRSLGNWRRQAVLEGPMSLFEHKRRESPPPLPDWMAKGKPSW